MKINIKFLDGNILNLNIDKNKIYDIKNEISVIKDIDIEKIKLIFGGKILKDEDTLEKHKIYNECTLNCIISKTTRNTSNENTEDENTENENSQNNNIPNFNTNASSFANLFNNIEINNSQFPNTLFNSENTTQFVNMISNNDQLRNHIIDSSLQRMNLPLNSPLRNFFETNINLLTQAPELLNQFTNNNFDPPPYSPLDENIESLDSHQDEIVDNDDGNYEAYSEENEIDSSNDDINEDNDSNSDEEDSDDDDDDDNETFYKDLKEKYSSQFEEVKNMGFEDEELILKTLLQCHGSVAITINKLVEM